MKAESILSNIGRWTNTYSFLIDEIIININKKTFEESLKFISSLKVNEDFLENEEVYVDLLFMYKYVHQTSRFNQHSLFIELNLRDIFLEVYKLIYDVKNKFNFVINTRLFN